MGVFPAAGYAVDRFRTEGNVKAISSEYFTNDDAGFELIVGRLQRIGGEKPVQFQLFAYVENISIIIDFRLDAAHFFVAHFYMHAAGIEFFDGLLHGSTDIATHALPVLFLETLGNGKVLHRFLFAGRLHPEFQLGAGGENDVLDFREWEIFHALHLGAYQKLSQAIGYVLAGCFQDGAGVDVMTIVDEEAGDAEGTDRKPGLFIDVVIIIVYIPIHGAVGYHVHTSIVQGRNIHKYHRRAVGLYSLSCEEIFVVFHEDFHGNTFVCVIACQIDPYQRYEPNFRMLGQEGKYPFFAILTSRNAVQ